MIKAKILSLLETVNRHGMENVIAYLNESDFFTAPASTKYHCNYTGGLAEHSLNVYELLDEKVKRFKLDVPDQSIIICALLHDVCKIDFYKEGQVWYKDDGLGPWKNKQGWKVEDSFPTGHGEKSVFILQRFMQLTDEEVLAIRWHMGMCDPGTHFNYPSGMAYQTASKHKLVTLLQTADYEASYVVEKTV